MLDATNTFGTTEVGRQSGVSVPFTSSFRSALPSARAPCPRRARGTVGRRCDGVADASARLTGACLRASKSPTMKRDFAACVLRCLAARSSSLILKLKSCVRSSAAGTSVQEDAAPFFMNNDAGRQKFPREHTSSCGERAKNRRTAYLRRLELGWGDVPIRIVNEVRFAVGPAPGASPLVLKPSAMTVFVGPNNCGKSTALKEIAIPLIHPPYGDTERRNVVSSITFAPQLKDSSVVGDLLQSVPREDDEDGSRFRYYCGGGRPSVLPKDLTALCGESLDDVGAALGSIFTAQLDGPSRLNIVTAHGYSDLLGLPENHLMALFLNGAARRRLRDLVHEAFEAYLVIDPTQGRTLRVRMSSRPPRTSPRSRRSTGGHAPSTRQRRSSRP